jgi:hypothetical protein
LLPGPWLRRRRESPHRDQTSESHSARHVTSLSLSPPGESSRPARLPASSRRQVSPNSPAGPAVDGLELPTPAPSPAPPSLSFGWIFTSSPRGRPSWYPSLSLLHPRSSARSAQLVPCSVLRPPNVYRTIDPCAAPSCIKLVATPLRPCSLPLPPPK